MSDVGGCRNIILCQSRLDIGYSRRFRRRSIGTSAGTQRMVVGDDAVGCPVNHFFGISGQY